MSKVNTNAQPEVQSHGIRVSAVHSPTGEATALLEQLLTQSRFWEIIEAARVAQSMDPAEFSVLIKPDMEYFDQESTTGTDPKMVEHLVDLLADRGYVNVVIADGLGSADLWLENRDVIILADLAGYQFVTENGNDYDILNLSEEVIEGNFPAGSPLEGSGLSQHWQDAHFRINFCKNKSDEENGFALGLHNLVNILPLRDKRYHYQNRLRYEEVGAALLTATEVHFTIIDAFISNHGSQGTRYSNPLETRTFIGGNDVLLTDYVGAMKMGQDPYVSRLNAHALRTLQLPPIYELDGDLSTYVGWIAPSQLLRQSVYLRNQSLTLGTASVAWLQSVDTERFPFKHLLDEQINSMVTPLIQDMDAHPAVYWVLVGTNYLLAYFNRFVEGWQVMYAKDRLYRKETALGIDLKTVSSADFEAVESYVRPLAEFVKHAHPDANGLKWRYIDGSVLFEFSRILDIPYDDFIGKVEIAQAVQMVYDNIGGNQVPVKHDEQQRVIYQAERDIYLPQPNWMVLFGGKFIDVGKLEVVRYGDDQQQIFWRMVASENNSAQHDDGVITFERSGSGTKITIVARQQFELPQFWQLLPIDFFPKIKDALISDAYVQFFSKTVANFQSVYEGKSNYIGRTYDETTGESESDSHQMVSEQLENVLNMVANLVSKWFNPGKKTSGTPGGVPDEYGYTHFTADSAAGPDAIKGFFQELSGAVSKDSILSLISKPSEK